MVHHNLIFERYGLSGEMQLGSNSPGPHESSSRRPVHYPEWDVPSDRGYVVSDHMINEPRAGNPFRIMVIGAGAAGIDFLHHAAQAFKGTDVEYVCYEKNNEIGGTWLENRYPGCACDVPSASYTFPWRPNPSWTKFYSTAQEIWQYMKNIVDEEDMMKNIQLRCQVLSATWDEQTSRWTVKLRRDSTDNSQAHPLEWEESCDVLINGGGFLKYATFNLFTLGVLLFQSLIIVLARGSGLKSRASKHSRANCSIQHITKRTTS